MVELCIHLANVFYLISYLTRDMLWLRALTCGGLALGILFFSCQPRPLYGPTAWHVVFLVINGVQIWRLITERRKMTLSEEQERLAEAALHDLSRDELVNLLTHLTYENPRRLRDVRRLRAQELSPDERVLRDLAFSRLSRKELLNLLARRLWNSLARRTPSRWRRRRHVPEAASSAPRRVSSGAR